MIKLKTMTWSNLFSYGENNSIEFDKSPLTQIVGLNGHGKSSIALILEEVLYNKNSKNIKKSDILNRNSKAKSYSIELVFEKDNSVYTIKTTRGSTQTVVLLKDGVDISSHTATNTFKSIEEIIGFDHKTFSQLVYQSSASSLEFLTATDSNRKKFLIDLLNLNKYTEIGDVFKKELTSIEKELSVLSGKFSTTEAWLEKYKKSDLTEKPIQEVPDYPKHWQEENAELLQRLNTLEQHNKKILQNNKYKELLDSIKLEAPGPKPELDLNTLLQEKAVVEKTAKDSVAFVQKLRSLNSSCPTCMQDIDYVKVATLVEEHHDICKINNTRADSIKKEIEKFKSELGVWENKEKSKRQYEEYYALYDNSLPTDTITQDEVLNRIKSNKAVILEIEDKIKKIADYNNRALQHNAKIEVLKESIIEQEELLQTLLEEKNFLEDKYSRVNVLVKTFSSTGLIAYKIECLIKDLEDQINEYLSHLSYGRFQLSFKLNNDKLNVVITDNSRDVEITALSSGEKARVNTAALLGIRKLMQSISNTRINLLVLDETIENLDIEGKEKLVEILLQEPHLNTFVISHGFSHPLLEKLQVTKTKNISRIEYG
jgi:DNA repair exonuclease SbcCD ATPase subunit